MKDKTCPNCGEIIAGDYLAEGLDFYCPTCDWRLMLEDGEVVVV